MTRQPVQSDIGSGQSPVRTVGWRRRGATLVEMALVAPIFFMVVLAIIEFGRAMMVSQMVTNAAREGARMACIDGSSNATVKQRIQDFLQDAAAVAPGAETITITVDNANAGNEVANAVRGDACTIQIQVPFDQVQYVAGKYLSGVNLVGHSTMRHE